MKRRRINGDSDDSRPRKRQKVSHQENPNPRNFSPNSTPPFDRRQSTIPPTPPLLSPPKPTNLNELRRVLMNNTRSPPSLPPPREISHRRSNKIENNNNLRPPIGNRLPPPVSELQGIRSTNSCVRGMKEMIVYVDEGMKKKFKLGRKNLIRRLKLEFEIISHETGIEHIVERDNSIINTIKFGRKRNPNGPIEPFDDFTLIRMYAVTFANFVVTDTLDRFLQALEIKTKGTVVILIEGMKLYLEKFRSEEYDRLLRRTKQSQSLKNKNKKNPDITKKQVDDIIMKITEERERIRVFLSVNHEFTTETIIRIIKTLASRWYKDPMPLNLYGKYKKTLFRKAKNPGEVWYGMLREISSGIYKGVANAICKVYPTPKALMMKYREKNINNDPNFERSKEMLLVGLDIESNGLRIGETVSKKIYKFFTERDGDKIFK